MHSRRPLVRHRWLFLLRQLRPVNQHTRHLLHGRDHPMKTCTCHLSSDARVKSASRRSWQLACSVLCLLSLSIAGCKGAKASAARNPAGTLPVGCSMVAHLKPSELGPIGTLFGRLLAAPVSRIKLPGLDLNRGVNEVTFCRLPAPASESLSPEFVMLISGGLPSGFMQQLAEAQHQKAEIDPVARVPVLGHERLWLARRSTDGQFGELVLASNRDSLRTTLVGPAGSYTRDGSSPLAVVMMRGELERISTVASATSTRNADGSRLGVAREVRVNLSPSGDDLTARFVIGDAASAQRLTALVQPALSAFMRQAAGPSSQADVSVSVQDGDTVAHVHLPKGSIESLIQRAIAMKGQIGFAPKPFNAPPSYWEG